jgi:hypothetical protein
VTGRLGALKEKYLVETVALLIVIAVVPVFVADTVSILLVPAVTLPKLRLVLPHDKPPVGGGEPVLTPWQPSIAASARKVAIAFPHVAMRFIREVVLRLARLQVKRLVCL